MTHIIFVLLSSSAAFAAKPKFHCYTTPGSHVGAYQTAVKCAGKDKMEIVCTYTAGCIPAKKPGEAPALDQMTLQTMAVSGELKSSFLICKGKGEIKDGVIDYTKVQCPPPTQCLTDGLFGGVSAGQVSFTDTVTVPEKGAPRVTR